MIVYDKSSAQKSGPYKLEEYVAKRVRGLICGYVREKELLKELRGKSFLSEADIADITDKERNINTVDVALREWIKEDYWPAIKDLVHNYWRAPRKEKNQLKYYADKHFVSEETLRYQGQKFWYGVAKVAGFIR